MRESRNFKSEPNEAEEVWGHKTQISIKGSKYKKTSFQVHRALWQRPIQFQLSFLCSASVLRMTNKQPLHPKTTPLPCGFADWGVVQSMHPATSSFSACSVSPGSVVDLRYLIVLPSSREIVPMGTFTDNPPGWTLVWISPHGLSLVTKIHSGFSLV